MSGYGRQKIYAARTVLASTHELRELLEQRAAVREELERREYRERCRTRT